MAQRPTSRLIIDPPMQQWRVTPRNGRSVPLIATGHQPYLWHPGILAKDLAAAAFAQHIRGSALHLVVEHNPIDPLAIDLPTLRAAALGVRRLRLDTRSAALDTPPNRLPPLDLRRVIDALNDDAAASHDAPGIREPLDRIAHAYATQADHPHLAAQTTAVLNALKRPVTGTIPTRTTSGLVTPGFVDRLLADPLGCVRCYNRAAFAYPEAGIRPLYAGRDVVEAPLWAQDAGPSVPVYIDLGDSSRPQLFTHAKQGRPIDLTGPDTLGLLRPRAATLSALMRSEHCDLFIHGTGGGVYDQVTERWWRDWAGEDLAPMAVVSADAYLPLDAPTATRDELAQAVWFNHHLPHNVDRYTRAVDDADAASRTEKHHLLDHMQDDRDKRRRSKAFQRIHAINAELQARHQERIRLARQATDEAMVGQANADIAARRDWCFALYPDKTLMNLHSRVCETL